MDVLRRGCEQGVLCNLSFHDVSKLECHDIWIGILRAIEMDGTFLVFPGIGIVEYPGGGIGIDEGILFKVIFINDQDLSRFFIIPLEGIEEVGGF